MAYKRRAGDPTDGSWFPKAALEEGAWYAGKCRNASVAQWRDGAFHYSRYKFGTWFLEAIPHPDDDVGYDVFFPFKKTVRGIERFTAYRRNISERGTHTEYQRNPDDAPQFEGVIWSDGSVTHCGARS